MSNHRLLELHDTKSFIFRNRAMKEKTWRKTREICTVSIFCTQSPPTVGVSCPSFHSYRHESRHQISFHWFAQVVWRSFHVWCPSSQNLIFNLGLGPAQGAQQMATNSFIALHFFLPKYSLKQNFISSIFLKNVINAFKRKHLDLPC